MRGLARLFSILSNLREMNPDSGFIARTIRKLFCGFVGPHPTSPRGRRLFLFPVAARVFRKHLTDSFLDRLLDAPGVCCRIC